jgi:hypothetical protein
MSRARPPLKMDFPHLQKPENYKYTMTVSVFFFLSFDRAQKLPFQRPARHLMSLFCAFSSYSRSVISVPGWQQGKIMLD